MANFYLDIESSGFSIIDDKIITIQYQKLDSNGNPDGDLIILKEWELGEREMLKQFLKVFAIDYNFVFVPFMMNSIFDLRFILKKAKSYGLLEPNFDEFEFIYRKPVFDLKSTLIIMNDLQFKGCGLDRFTDKLHDGSIIPEWYKSGEYQKIIDYITMETESYLKFLQKIKLHLKEMKNGS